MFSDVHPKLGKSYFQWLEIVASSVFDEIQADQVLGLFAFRIVASKCKGKKWAKYPELHDDALSTSRMMLSNNGNELQG